jgi:hypothetical protein
MIRPQRLSDLFRPPWRDDLIEAACFIALVIAILVYTSSVIGGAP